MWEVEVVWYARPDDRKVHLTAFDAWKVTKCGMRRGDLASVGPLECLSKDTVLCEKCWPTPPVAARRR